jgi:hypothetical protein
MSVAAHSNCHVPADRSRRIARLKASVPRLLIGRLIFLDTPHVLDAERSTIGKNYLGGWTVKFRDLFHDVDRSFLAARTFLLVRGLCNAGAVLAGAGTRVPACPHGSVGHCLSSQVGFNRKCQEKSSAEHNQANRKLEHKLTSRRMI